MNVIKQLIQYHMDFNDICAFFRNNLVSILGSTWLNREVLNGSIGKEIVGDLNVFGFRLFIEFIFKILFK